MLKNKKICLSGGGTGGHITPLLSLYKILKNENIDFFWIGEGNSLEEKVANENNITFYKIKAGKLRRYFSLKTIIEPFNILFGIYNSYIILKKESPDLIFSKGGYVSLPVSIAAKILKINLFLHESDTVPGLANRIVSKFATKIFVGFEEAKKYFKGKNPINIGQILNPDLISDINQKISDNNKTKILVTGGSQGSRKIFKEVLVNLDKLKDFEISVILGSLNSQMAKDFLEYNNVTTYEFVSQNVLGKIMYDSDIAITRAGATSLAELEYFGLKMIIIPLEGSANNHQNQNAIEYLGDGNIIIKEGNIGELTEKIDKLKGFKKNKKRFDPENFNSEIIYEIKNYLY